MVARIPKAQLSWSLLFIVLAQNLGRVVGQAVVLVSGHCAVSVHAGAAV